ncbi:hypothetical protein [Leptospira borgpetersenii]|uniref:Uncharacterized protein n=1 Tax=Leptospira borgpetersenii str. 200801926 TaxID=1193009 RepID=A0ABN0HW66_LEPBO|nr:hypothetical protein [Leptospira borgpetersenii]EKP12976.1 hypothetical protein LEP1GSC128_3359 [Leptospira borgpetersenii str. 200801926]
MNQLVGNHVATIYRHLNRNCIILESRDQIRIGVLYIKNSCIDFILRLIGIQLYDFVQEVLKRRKGELVTITNDLLKRGFCLQMRFQGFFIHLLSNILNVHPTQETEQKLKIKKIISAELKVVK